MSFRRETLAVLGVGFALTLAACGGGGNGPEDITPQDWDSEDLPQWVRDLPEGEEPREDGNTQEAFLFLLQAQAREGEEARTAYESALEAAEAAIEADPENARGHYLAGEAELGLGNVEEAASHFDRAEEIYPRYVLETELLREQAWIDHYNAGAEALQAGQNDEAVRHFELAHTIYQGRPDAMLQLARLRHESGRTEEALELYTQAVDLMTGPRAEGLGEELGDSWQQNLAIARFNQAQIFFETERYDEAASTYRSIVEGDPDDLMARSNMAISLAAAGRAAEAQEVFDELMNRPDLTARDFYLVGVGLYEMEEYEEAARAFGRAAEVIPGYRDALLNQVQALFLAEAWEEIVPVAERLLAVDTHGGAAHQFFAQALVRLGEEHEAVSVMEQLEALPFEVDELQLQRTGGRAVILGVVINQNMTPGEEVRLRIVAYGADGTEVGSTEVAVPVGEVDEAVTFQADFADGQQILAYRYEVIG